LRREFHNQHIVGYLQCARLDQAHELVVVVRTDRHDNKQFVQFVALALRIVQVTVLVIGYRLLVEYIERVYYFRVQFEAIVVDRAERDKYERAVMVRFCLYVV
jgi:hypothetical protein